MDAAIRKHRQKFSSEHPLVISNAYRMAFTQSGLEIYGITEIISWSRSVGLGLVISDPSGEYLRWAASQSQSFDHVLFLPEKHNFIAALRYCDIFVRNTVTDGDSLSIHEALALQKAVWATSVVSRPDGTFCYVDINDIDPLKPFVASKSPAATVPRLLQIYSDLKDIASA
jgi:hypothetical protein